MTILPCLKGICLNGHVEIELTQGKKAVISVEDFELVSQINWFYDPPAKIRGSRATHPESARGYFRPDTQKGKMVRLHRFIMGITDPAVQVDHKDRNRLDNSRCNLRIAIGNGNNYNRRKISGTSSQYKGVSFNKARAKWRAKIKKDNVERWLGTFDNEEDAARAYDKAAEELFGSFAYLNFPAT